jgi:hypothetical protein
MIESYKILDESVQSDGTQRVRVGFTDHLGTVHNRSYDFPKDAIIADSVVVVQVAVDAGLKDQDIQKALSQIERGDSFKLDFASTAELKTVLQEVEMEKQSEIDQLTVEKANVGAEVR